MSDHRRVWFDISKFPLYGYKPPQKHFYHARRLNIIDPRVVGKYITYLHIAMQDHDIFHRIGDIHKVVIYSLRDIVIDR